MVLGILTAIAACPAIIGTTEAVRQGQRKSAKEKHRGAKSNLIVSCPGHVVGSREINAREIVLCNNKLYVALDATESLPQSSDHPFAGYFLPYPETNWGRKGEGLVSTISDDPPQLNWIYVDKDTLEIKYGIRTDSQDHIVGPWDCTIIDKRLTLEGWEGFVAVREEPGSWALYFDQDDNGLKGILDNHRKVEIQLIRKEKRQGRPDDVE